MTAELQHQRRQREQAPHRRANARANIAFAPANEPSPFQGLEPRANPISRMRAMAAALAITLAMDEQNVAIEGLRTPRHADVSFRRSRPLRPASVTIRPRANRIGRWKDAVVYRAGFANEPNPLKLGFRNKS